MITENRSRERGGRGKGGRKRGRKGEGGGQMHRMYCDKLRFPFTIQQLR
jgi:hypothetical protein